MTQLRRAGRRVGVAVRAACTCSWSSISSPGSIRFIIIIALPGALAGIVWALFATQTTLSVPALMGAIMSVGVATANCVLIVVFANESARSACRRATRRSRPA